MGKQFGFVLTTFLLSCRVRLSKRRAKAGAQSTTNAVLVCKHRDMNEKELEAQVSVPVTFNFVYSHHTYTSFILYYKANVLVHKKFNSVQIVVVVVIIIPFIVILRKHVKLSLRTMSQKMKRKTWTWIKTCRTLVSFPSLSIAY